MRSLTTEALLFDSLRPEDLEVNSDLTWLRTQAAEAHRDIESMFRQARIDAARILNPDSDPAATIAPSTSDESNASPADTPATTQQ